MDNFLSINLAIDISNVLTYNFLKLYKIDGANPSLDTAEFATLDDSSTILRIVLNQFSRSDEAKPQQGEYTAIVPGSVAYPLLIVFQRGEERKPNWRNGERARLDGAS
jgi:hypothetical protein